MNYRSTRSPIAAESFPFALPLAAVAITAFALDFDLWGINVANIIGVLAMIALVFVLAFFRNPERYFKQVPNAVYSGADGRVDSAGIMAHPDFPGGQCLRIAVFMSVFDCHINWAPVGGRVVSAVHHAGCFMNAMHDKCAEENERKVIVMETDSGHHVEVKLIAGLVARRIVCPLEAGDVIKQGEKIGLIRFGSRVEVLLPAESALHVRPGMMIKGSETLIATLPDHGGQA
jgi:phosphatidylserine decarboxylase